jgi:uncharacterized protein (TIGR00161 family)
MKIKLDKKPKNPIIIQGFPGFGLIGTITTEFLIEHLNASQIGDFFYDELPATLAIHEEKLINPMAVFYDKKNNIVILHTILNTGGAEWKIAEEIVELANDLEAKEIISLEGVSSPIAKSEESRVFFYTKDNETKEKLKSFGLAPLKEGIIMGVTASTLLRNKVPITCFFAETHSQLPDSKAAAKLIEHLDKYLGLEIDYKPLLKQAEEFEGKLKKIMQQTETASKERDKKALSYLG